MNQELPTSIVRFVKELDGVLGTDLIGVILFGSWASGQPTDSSDLDLAVVVSDSNADKARFEAFRVLDRSTLDRDLLSMSVESYLRIKEFLDLGDPFAWVVCSCGTILHDRNGLLEDLHNQCERRAGEPVSPGVVQYLHNKARTHHLQVMQAFRQFLSHCQLSVMAGAQAAAVQISQEPVSGSTLVAMTEWKTLTMRLAGSLSETDEQRATELILAHKQARQEPPHTVNDLPNKLTLVTEALSTILQQQAPNISKDSERAADVR